MICGECGKSEMKVVDGWESRKALECPNCGEYCYFVGSIACIKTAHFDDTGGINLEVARKLLDENTT